MRVFAGRVAGLRTLRVPLLVLLVCLAFAAGVLLVAAPTAVPLETWSSAGLAIALAGAAGGLASVWRRRRWPIAFIGVLAFGLGLLRAAIVLTNPTMPWRAAPAELVEAIAVVEAPPQIRGPSAIVTARIERIDQPDGLAPPDGRVQLTIGLPSPSDGDRIHVRGQFDPVRAETGRGQRLLAQGISATAWQPEVAVVGQASDGWLAASLRFVRREVDAALRRMLPEPHASLLAGLLLGAGDNWSDEFVQALRSSGTTHIVVVSGYNISLVAGTALALFGRWRGAGSVAALLTIWAFVALTGGAPPSVRAALMGTVALLASRTGRGADAMGALGLTSAAMLAVDPRLALDLGFELSVAATFGIIALQPRVSALLVAMPAAIREPLAGTLAAQLATVPLLAAAFHQISVVAPLTNLLAAPAVPVATIAGAIGVAVTAVLPVVSPVVGAILMVPTGYLVGVIEATGSIPGAATPVGDVSPVAAGVYALLLIGWAAFPTPEGRDFMGRMRSPRVARALLAGSAALIGVTVAWTVAAAFEKRAELTLSILDVGGGDAVLIRTPGGSTVLIDGGPSPSALMSELGRRLGIAERTLSLALVSSGDVSQLAGPVAAAERYAPVAVVGPSAMDRSALWYRWQAASRDRLVAAEEPLTIAVEPEVTIELLPLPAERTASRQGASTSPTLMLRVVHGANVFLLARNLSAEAVGRMVAAGWPAAPDVFVGSAQAGSTAAEGIAPSIVILQAAPRGRERGTSGKTTVTGSVATYRTDAHGSVEVTSDGRRLSVRTSRSPCCE